MDVATRDSARRALQAYGVRLGALLATLKHPGTAEQQGDTPVRHAYLTHWLGVQRVWLGGGLLASANAAEILAGAHHLLARSGTDVELRVGPSPTVLPLLGAARMAEPHDGPVVVADAGHSAIKAAVAVVTGGTLAALTTVSSWPAPTRRAPHAVEAAIVDVLAPSTGALGTGPGRRRRVIVSVAGYLRDGAPVDDGRSIYGGIEPSRIRRSLAARTRHDLVIEFVHDGSASACGIADPEPSAVVTAGTWLGIGFTPATRRFSAEIRCRATLSIGAEPDTTEA